MNAPHYFEPIRRKAAGRWDQLDRDAELAAPWVQLFNQVQSPRHVVSELLQNADDAGAARVSVRLVAGQLVFEHDGQDFIEEHFDSLCKFAYSNKRKLHTIGFRGIGFKSTFSLGPEVRLVTPTLAVAFRRERFTEPVWTGEPTEDGSTRVSVQIDDPNRERELAKNLAEWRASPASLLFFRHVRELDIDGTQLRRTTVGPGPVPNAVRVRLSSIADRELLLLRSGTEPFPAECLAEVRRERGEPHLELPGCEVELVLGLTAAARVYVVLPTGVGLDLPYSCNGPFIQDPARMAIKDPATSPTNRWLLGRVGRLAAETLLGWLGDTSLSLDERAGAYALFPPGAQPRGAGIGGEVSGAVREAFRATLGTRPLLLTQSGRIVSEPACVAPPRELYGVWTEAQLGEVFRRPGVDVLAEVVPDVTRGFLTVAGLLRPIAVEGAIAQLQGDGPVPRPNEWGRLAALWRCVAARLRFGWAGIDKRGLALVPVQGEEALYPADAVVRLPATRLSDEDARFLAGNSRVIDGGWVEFVGRPVQGNADGKDDLRETLGSLGLASASTVEKVFEVVCGRAFEAEQVPVADAVRVAHLSALLDAKASDGMRYMTEKNLHPVQTGLVWDPDGLWDDLLPAAWLAEHRVNRLYDEGFSSCTRQQWTDWAGSPKSRLTTFPPVRESEERYWNEPDLGRALAARGCPVPTEYPYPKGYFQLYDHDFPAALVKQLTEVEGSGTTAWGRLLEAVLSAAPELWANTARARVYRFQNSKNNRPVTTEPLAAAWVHRLRSVRCLPDGYGVYREPAELYLRTPETEPLLGVEPFVRAELDTEATKPLLRLLGVRDTPAGADKLIARVRAWTLTPKAVDHLREVVRWYEALDRVLARAGTDVVGQARTAFRAEPLVLTHTGDWARAAEVFQAADDDALPDTPTVHTALRGLTLWTRLEIADRPTSSHVLAWLGQLPAGEKLDGPTARRVQAASRRYPVVTWTQCGCWLTLAGGWTPTNAIKYRITMQELTRWRDLFPALRAATADLRGLPVDVIQAPPFDTLEDLTAAIEFRPAGVPPGEDEPTVRPWVAALAAGLRRVRLSDDGQTWAVREAATRLAGTTWQTVTRLLAQPWIAGEAVGDPSPVAALWFRETLFVNGSRAKWFDPVADALARGFPDAGQVRQVIRDCIDRDPAFVAEYLAEKFELEAEEPLTQPVPVPPAEPQGTVGSTPPPGQALEPLPDAPPADTPGQTAGPGEHPAEPQPPTEGPVGEQLGDPPHEEPPPVAPAPTKQKPPPGPTVFERFAATMGFTGTEDRGFRHPDGSALVKAVKPFGWELRGPDGLAVRNYAVVGNGLLTDGVEVPAELWAFITNSPNLMTLVAPAPDGTPTEWPGPTLIQLKNDSRLKVYPRAYLFRVDGV